MWKLLKNELLYRRTILLISMALGLMMAVLFVRLGHLEPGMSAHAFRILIVLCVGLVWLVRLMGIQKEKSDRMIRMLPVKAFSSGMVRVLFLFVLWIVMLALFQGANLIVSGWAGFQTNLLGSLSFTALFLIANSLSLLNRDHRFCGLYKPLRISLTLALTIVMMGGYFLFIISGAMANELGTIIESTSTKLGLFYNSTRGAVFLITVGLLLSVCSVAVYNKRNNFIE